MWATIDATLAQDTPEGYYGPDGRWRKWRYTDEERQWDKYARCYDCGKAYDEYWGDCLVSNEVWERINPTYHARAGLLCTACMHARLRALHLKDIVYIDAKFVV